MVAPKRPLEGGIEPAETDHARQTKQQRMDPENFPKGTIIKIRCKDFMTYKEAVFKPSPRLNLILAPNGAGKSSLTCALCLGLAGDPKILGRADKAINFIRRGQEEALTEVTLSAGPGKYPLVIQRRLTKDNLSKYSVNGVEKRRSDVVDLMNELNVQLDNLCQFLPQDKVQSFAQMTPKQLLEESERALADGKYYQIHQELVQETKLLESSERVANALQNTLEDQEKLLAEVTRDKDRFQQRKALEEQATLLGHRVAWLEVKQAREEAASTKRKLEQGQQLLLQRQKELQESQAPVKERADAAGSQKRTVDGLVTTVNQAEKALNADYDMCKDLAEKAQQKWEDIEGLKQQAERQRQDVAKAEAALAKARADLEGLPGLEESASQNAGDIDALKSDLRDLAAQVTDYGQNLAGVKGSYDDHSRDLRHYQEQAKRLDDAKNIKLRQLEYSSRGITEFTRWVEKAKADGMFRGEVLGPILLEVAIADPQHAKYLEQQMPQNIWPRFVTVFHEDQDLLRKAASERNYRSLYCTNYTGSSTTPLQYPSGRAEEYSMQGVTHTLDQVFTAPLIIKKVMNDESGITRAFVGSGNCDWKTLMAGNHKVSNLYTPESNYRKSASAYNPAAKTQSVSAIREALRFLGGAQDDREERNQLAKLIADGKEALNNIKNEQLALEELNEKAVKLCTEKRAAVRKLENQAIERKNRKGKLEAAVKAKERILQDRKRKPDPMQRAAGLQRDIARLNTQVETAVQKVLADFKKLAENHRDLGCESALLREIKAQVVALQQQHKGADDAVRQAKELALKLKSTCESDVRTYKRIKAEAQTRTGRLEEVPELRAALDALSDNLEELQADIERLRDEAAVIQCGNPRVMQEFKERTERVRKLKEEYGDASTGLQNLTAAVEEKKAGWLPEIQRMVKTVNSHFQRMLSGMGCNGQVSLYCGCPEFDGCNAFDKYAIHIRVKFRDEEELQLLTANRQSGGERAVCTILYIVALQHVTVTPFRVVDEINQGMDRINERKVFIQMVDAACRPGTPQCFMFTPKLLPDLPYTYDVMPMTIFNGIHNEELTADLSDESFAKGMPIVYEGPIAA